jgi:hypothetical protein
LTVKRLTIAAVAITALAVLAPSGAAAAPAPSAAAGTVSEGVPQFGHVFVIIGENTQLTQVTKKHMPYLVGTIKPNAAWLTGYRATGHFSTGNTSR